jgi:uncharacterized membrane protein YeaQ/YmgE (transglycosylase-associated protein family)
MILSLIIGGIAGWLAGLIMKGDGYGIIVDILLGIVGGWVGRWLFGILNLHFGGSLGALFTSLVGAIILIAIVRAIKR